MRVKKQHKRDKASRPKEQLDGLWEVVRGCETWRTAELTWSIKHAS